MAHVPCRLVVAVLCGLLLGGCFAATPRHPLPPAPTPERFVAFGDAGTGAAGQLQVAHAMERVCQARGCQFALELGDNIYDSGVSSDRDPQFDAKFEVPYRNFTIPFYVVLGNHDNSQDPASSGATAGFGTWYESGNHEVDYAKRTDRASDKWTMPARYYAVQRGNVSLVALDTNTLLFDDVPVPPDVMAVAKKQTDWIDGAMAGAGGPWRIVLGHHPYRSNGPHGNAGSYDGRAGVPGQSGDFLKQVMEQHVCGKADLILTGHDHDLEWLQPVAACGRTEQVVSGAGGAGLYDLGTTDPAFFQQKTLGFWWFEANATALHGVAYDGDGKVLFERSLHK